MKLNNISLPYPVLGVNDDIIPGLAEDAIKMDLISREGSDYVFSLDLKITNLKILSYINEGFAIYSCEIDCPATLQRYSLTSINPHFDLRLAKNCYAGEVEFNCSVTVIKPISNYTNDCFNPDYADFSFNLEVGNILAGFPKAVFDVDLKYDKLQAAGAYMQIREEKNKDYTNIELNDKTIDIKLPTPLFKMYNSGLGLANPEVMHASIAYSALVTALYELQCNYEQHRHSYWARAIRYRLETEDKLRDLADVSEDRIIIQDVSSVASVLLNDPYNRMFNCLSQNADNESISDE